MLVDRNLNIPLMLRAAQTYTAQGFSVIPLRRGSKIAAVPWQSYQQHGAPDALLRAWFEHEGHTGLAIVTGAAFGLVVLDFDTDEAFRDFAQSFPQLLDTRTVRTPRGWHLYYRLPKRVRLRTRQVPGIDLQLDGRYVVAPPTTIGGHTYAVVHDRPPRMLDVHQQDAITAFLDARLPQAAPTQTKMDNTDSVPLRRAVLPAHLLANYARLAPQVGRNHALFRTALLARDGGWTRSQTAEVLVDVHVRQRPNGSHRPETPDQRAREAHRTLASAFSRPARQQPAVEGTGTEGEDKSASWLPNAVREALLARKQTAVLRTLEGLQQLGVAPGARVHQSMVIQQLSGLVGAHSVRKAFSAGVFLDADASEEMPLSPAPPLPTCTAAATPLLDVNKKTALVDTPQKPTLNRGRPVRWVVVPTPEQLCARLGVRMSGGDRLHREALGSARAYRQALHAALLRRRPGQYSRALLARRLGVGATTVRAYDRAVGAVVTPLFCRVPLFWHNLKRLVPRRYHNAPAGAFLCDASGKRYPLKYPLACRLLKAGGQVAVLVREPNHYALPGTPDEAQPGWAEPALPDGYTLSWQMQDPRAAPATGTDHIPCPPPAAPPSAIRVGERVLAQRRPGWVDGAAWRGETPLTPQQVDEWTARVVETINTHLRVVDADADKRISVRSARALVTRYPPGLIQRGLALLGTRSSIHDPAGFLTVYLRSEHKWWRRARENQLDGGGSERR